MLPGPSLPDYERFIERAGMERARAIRALFSGAGRVAARALRDIALWRRRRATLRELQGLDDRMLKDIGLYRGEIWSAADAVAHGLEPEGRLGRSGEAVAPRPAEEEPAPAAAVLKLPPIYTGARAA